MAKEKESGTGREGGDTEPKKKGTDVGTKKYLEGFFTGLATFAGITGISLVALFQPTAVPDVVGMDPEGAKATLSDAGFLADTTGDGDIVVSESPDANSMQFKWVRVSLQLEEGLDKYSWEQLADISDQIASADSDKEAISIAAQYGLCKEDGTLDGTQAKDVTLKDGTQAQVRVLGFRHDDRADGKGKAGITWGFTQTLATHQYNATDSSKGGRASSSLRGYMNDEVYAELPDDLKKQIKQVEKLTDNVGPTTETSSVTPTADLLWAPSVKELLGDVDWWHADNGDRPFYDDVYNAEGEQYQLFDDQGINGNMNRVPALQLSGPGGTCWWTRTPNPFEDQENQQFQGIATFINGDGYNEHDGKCSTSYGVVPCFCI